MTNYLITAGRHTIVPEDMETHIRVEIGAFTSIASGVKVISGQHPPVVAPECVSTFPFSEHGWGEYPKSKMDGEVYIGNDVWIGEDVKIMEGAWIGDGAIIGAGSLVTGEISPYSIAVGVPARLKKWRFDMPTVDLLLKVKWWKYSDEAITQDFLPYMSDINNFRKEFTNEV